MIGYCDNTDCVVSGKNLILEVELIDDFNKDRCYWCMNCIERDSKMIERVISENE